MPNARRTCRTLRIDHSANVFQNPKAIGMISKQGNWVPYELKSRDFDRRFLTCELLLARLKRKGFLHRIVTGDEKWIHYDNPQSAKNRMVILATHSHRLQSQIFMSRSGCFVYGGTSVVWSTWSCENRMKRSQSRSIDVNWCVWKKQGRKIGRFSTKGMTKLFFSMTTIGQMLLRWSKYTWKGRIGKSSPDIAPSVYHLFRALTHGLAEQHLLWGMQKMCEFLDRSPQKNAGAARKMAKVVASGVQYFQRNILYQFSTIKLQTKKSTWINSNCVL